MAFIYANPDIHAAANGHFYAPNEYQCADHHTDIYVDLDTNSDIHDASGCYRHFHGDSHAGPNADLYAVVHANADSHSCNRTN